MRNIIIEINSIVTDIYFFIQSKKTLARQWWWTPLIPALREAETSGWISVSSRLAWTRE